MTGRYRVLVVDDDFRVAELHAECVAAVPGFEVAAASGTAAGARTAVERAAAGGAPVDLALVDVYLPDGSGLDLVRELGCDAYVLTAANDGASVRRALAAGALGYLVKPFAPERLAQAVRGYGRYRALLDAGSPLDQDAVDRALAALRGGRPPAPHRVSAAQSATRDLVLGAVQGCAEPSSAGEVAARVGVSRATAQRYLAGLVAAGALRMRLRYGATGRPEQEYWAAG